MRTQGQLVSPELNGVSTGSEGPHEVPESPCLHMEFERQARETPDAVALLFEGEPISYGDLDARAATLARRLRARGVGPETLVGVFLETSPDLVATLLAILKAGAAFVPLDTTHPSNRNRQIIEESQLALIVTNNKAVTSALSHETFEIDTLILDQEAGDRVRGIVAGAPSAIGISSDNLAYVMFTSGSTGTPKGVGVPHCVIVNYLAACFGTYAPIDDTDVVLQLCSAAYAGSLRDMIGPLTRGATVVLLPAGDTRDPSRVLEACRRYKVTAFLATTPSLLSMLADDVDFSRSTQSLRLTLVGAESAVSLRQESRRYEPLGRLINHYGTTECGLIVTHAAIDPGTEQVDESAGDDVGRPIPGASVYVLDERLLPVPNGAIGEVHFGGFVVTRGYLRQPALTAERFLPDPQSKVPGARMYATGDLGYLDEAGCLRLRGRKDDQVKVRGHRVELREIEVVLRSAPEVRDVAVFARDDTPVGTAIVAYVVPRSRQLDQRKVLEFLAQRLPSHAVPKYLVPLRMLPIGPTGKVDRQGLPSPVSGSGHCSDMANDPVLRVIAEICGALLGIAGVGGEDDFFLLGGDSLSAARVVNRLRERGLTAQVTDLLEQRTIRAFARTVGGYPAELTEAASGER